MEDIIEKLNRDLKKAAETINDQEARYLVDLYYQTQNYRIKAGNQVRKLDVPTDDEPHETIAFFGSQYKKVESQIKNALHVYVKSKPIGQWLLSICGIGPVIAAGLIAHIDINKCETAGSMWRFAGLDPTVEWKKKELRPWNATLKTICWKAGESFVKTQNKEDDVYGHLYKLRKDYETEKNENGDYAEIAKKKLEKFNIGKNTDAYAAYNNGKLPPAHIHARAKRYAVKIFLSHLFDVWYELEKGKEPPRPFAIDILGHAHMIQVPNKELVL